LRIEKKWPVSALNKEKKKLNLKVGGRRVRNHTREGKVEGREEVVGGTSEGGGEEERS